MVDKLDFNELNDLVKEYLAYYGLESTLDCFEAEEKTKSYAQNPQKRGSS